MLFFKTAQPMMKRIHNQPESRLNMFSERESWINAIVFEMRLSVNNVERSTASTNETKWLQQDRIYPQQRFIGFSRHGL